MLTIELLTYVTFRGREIGPGEVVELDETNAASLVAAGLAQEIAPEGTGAAQSDETGDGVNIPGEDEKAEIERQRKALDDQYKRDELAEAAKAAGVDFPYDAKKAEIVEAVMNQEKAAALLK